MRSSSLFRLGLLIVLFLMQGNTNSTKLAEVMQDSRTRIIRFGGHRWSVKDGMGLAPANNDWSDDPRSVWIGTDGKLHLEIRRYGNVWYSSQIVSVGFTQYGLHRFYVESPLNSLNENVVLGLFLYADDQHEIDIELKRDGSSGTNAQYVVQPYTVSGNRYQYRLDDNGPTIYEIDWQPDLITFRTFVGDDITTAKLLQEWRYEGQDIPKEDQHLRIEMNLWMLDPNAQSAPVEVTISDLETIYCFNPLLQPGSS